MGSKRPSSRTPLNDDSAGQVEGEGADETGESSDTEVGATSPVAPTADQPSHVGCDSGDTWPDRRAPHPGTTCSLSATPSGRLLMIRRVGTRELDAQGRSPFVDSITQEVLTRRRS